MSDDATPDGPAIAARLRDTRERLRLTQADIAVACGHSPRGWQNWEQGTRAVPVSLVCALWRVYRIDPLWLLTGADRAGELREEAAGYQVAPVADRRLTTLLAALADWWGRASADERVWLDVEIRRRYGEVFARGVATGDDEQP